MEPRFFSIKKHPPYKGENLWMERKLGSYPESSSTSLGHIPRPRGPSRTRSSSQEATQIAGWEDVLWGKPDFISGGTQGKRQLQGLLGGLLRKERILRVQGFKQNKKFFSCAIKCFF